MCVRVLTTVSVVNSYVRGIRHDIIATVVCVETTACHWSLLRASLLLSNFRYQEVKGCVCVSVCIHLCAHVE